MRESLSPDTRNVKFQLNNLENEYHDLQTFSLLEKQTLAAEFYDELYKTKEELKLAQAQIKCYEDLANVDKSLDLNNVSMIGMENDAKR